MTGDLVFWSGRSIWSRLIRLRSESHFSHVGMIVERDDRTWVVESLEGKGVRLVPLSVWSDWVRQRQGHYAIYSLQASDVQRSEAAKFMLDRVGLEYASPRQFIRSFGWLSRKVCRWLGLPADEDATRYFCSELVAAALSSADLRIPKSPAMMTPGDVALLPYLDKIT